MLCLLLSPNGSWLLVPRKGTGRTKIFGESGGGGGWLSEDLHSHCYFFGRQEPQANLELERFFEMVVKSFA